MNKYLMRCDKCGWFYEANSIITEKCPQCGCPLIINDVEEDDKIAEKLESREKEIKERFKKEDVEVMKYQIKKYGNNIMWEKIETYKNAYRRAEERQLFFKSGGKIPKRRTEYDNI